MIYRCDLCDYSVDKHSFFDRHLRSSIHNNKMNIYTNYNSNLYECKMCNYTAPFDFTIVEHEMDEHTDEEYEEMIMVFSKYENDVIEYTNNNLDFEPFEYIYNTFKYWYYNNINRCETPPYSKNNLINFLIGSYPKPYMLNLYGIKFKNNSIINYTKINNVFSKYVDNRVITTRTKYDCIMFNTLYYDFRKWYYFNVDSKCFPYSEKNFLKHLGMKDYQNTNVKIFGIKKKNEECYYDIMFNIMDQWTKCKIKDIHWNSYSLTYSQLCMSLNTWYKKTYSETCPYTKKDIMDYFHLNNYKLDKEEVYGIRKKLN